MNEPETPQIPHESPDFPRETPHETDKSEREISGQERRKIANQQKFLEEYAKLGQISAAAEAAKLDRSCHYEWMELDPAYPKLFEAVKASLVENAKDTAYRLGVLGVLVPKTVAGVRELVREHDTRVLIRWLEVHDPAWRPHTDVNITNLSELTERLNAGRERAKAKEPEAE
ncbi:MAG TPA: hypothetical protein VKX49_12765 [Bryobacteraceae bacterium]|nr:hypothetical protein [Bryobacteraceae bacterium]